MKSKSTLRKRYKVLRANLSKEERKHASIEITRKIINNWNFIDKRISVFMSIQRLSEVDTSYLIERLGETNTLCAPVADLSSHEMNNFTFTKHSLKENEWGIPEPQDGDLIDSKEIDVVIIPLLISDIFGNRLGYGKGFYDRFLAKCRRDTLFIGINYFEPILQIPDVGEHDLPLDVLVTPNNLFESE